MLTDEGKLNNLRSVYLSLKMDQLLIFILFFCVFSNVICSKNEQLEASIKKCKKEKSYDIELQMKKWKNCVDDTSERFYDSIYSNKHVPYEMLCGNYGMKICLRNIQAATTRCSESKEIFGYSYNAIDGGLKYLCNDDTQHAVKAFFENGKKCLDEKRAYLEACSKNQEMELTFKMDPIELCQSQSDIAKCYVKVLDDCKNANISIVARITFENAFGATKCKDFYLPLVEPTKHDSNTSLKLSSLNQTILYFSLFILCLRIKNFL